MVFVATPGHGLTDDQAADQVRAVYLHPVFRPTQRLGGPLDESLPYFLRSIVDGLTGHSGYAASAHA